MIDVLAPELILEDAIREAQPVVGDLSHVAKWHTVFAQRLEDHNLDDDAETLLEIEQHTEWAQAVEQAIALTAAVRRYLDEMKHSPTNAATQEGTS